jgi:hypothetical protein
LTGYCGHIKPLTTDPQEAIVFRPRGRPTIAGTELRVRLTDSDRRYVESMSRVMNVSYSEFSRMVLKTIREENREILR